MIAHPTPDETPTPPPTRRRILGVRVDDVTAAEALRRIDGYRVRGGWHQVVTPNSEIVMLARRDPAYRAVIEDADLALPDGVGLRWAGAVLGQPVRAVVPGSDTTEHLAALGAPRGERWFLLGAAEGVAEEAGRRLAARHPGLVVAGTFAGSPDPADAEAIVARIRAAAPVDTLLVAFGAPAQDLWLARHGPATGATVTMGVGGTLNFISGRSPRPPALVRRLGLIWLFRLATEPWRWRRQLALVRFVGLVLSERTFHRKARKARKERHKAG